MIRILACGFVWLAAVPLPAQYVTGSGTGDNETITMEVTVPPGSAEAADFRKLMRGAGTGPLDYARLFEEFLEKYPDTQKRPEIERSIVQTAIDGGDRRGILKFGESVIRREPHNLIFVEHVIRALLETDDPESSKRALVYASQFEQSLRVLEPHEPSGGSKLVQFRERIDWGLAKARVFRARALGNLGRFEEAAKAAKASYETKPTAEAAREAGRWLSRLERDEEAIERYADAFAMDDADTTPKHRAKDRRILRDLYTNLRGSEEGLGALTLAAYDRTALLLAARHQKFLDIDPNLDASGPMDYVLSGLGDERLEMNSLLGKVVVLDFWATWCKPCRVQQPLYEEAKQRYADNQDVVFLNINTDANRDVVAPFLEKEGWDKSVYFEDGLQRLLKVTSIPTTVIIDRQGGIASRMNGFHPELFVDMLSERIDRALATE